MRLVGYSGSELVVHQSSPFLIRERGLWILAGIVDNKMDLVDFVDFGTWSMSYEEKQSWTLRVKK